MTCVIPELIIYLDQGARLKACVTRHVRRSACCAGVTLLEIVFTERLDFARDFGDNHMEALTRALVDDKVCDARNLQQRLILPRLCDCVNRTLQCSTNPAPSCKPQQWNHS